MAKHAADGESQPTADYVGRHRAEGQSTAEAARADKLSAETADRLGLATDHTRKI